MDKLFPNKKEANFNDPEWERLQIEKAKTDTKAFGSLYEKYHKQIFLYIKKKINNTEESEDLAAQVFEKAMKNLKKFQWQGIPLSSWLYRIARNTINDYLRSIRNVKTEGSESLALETAIDNDIEDSMDVLIKDEMQEEILKAIAKLSDTDQYLVYYKYFEGLSNIKIAETVGMSETNVGTRLNRLKAKLKMYIKS